MGKLEVLLVSSLWPTTVADTVAPLACSLPAPPRSLLQLPMIARQCLHSRPDLRLAFPWRSIRCCLLLVIALGPASGAGAADPERVDFQRQIRPILAAKCFTCHGPDEAAREADLRLDLASDALADRGGYAAIQPGDHEASELWQRISSDDEDLRMPPPGPQEPLTPEQIELLARWIDQGAEYQQHWAFVPPHAPEIPLVDQTAASPIDAFINARLAQAELEPLPPADPYTLIRRLYLDLIGIPPTPQEADAFAADPSPLAYARLVDGLLARPEYAERWARPWLDLARYADTNGYEKDRPRTIWPYRDWVLAALNADMPFDQFSIRQLAGDMLPEATIADRIATGFHRNTMLNEEGGIDPEEFRFHAMTDRVATTGTIWMGLTVGCAQCHTHKYDPITHTDYYALFALLNGADDLEQAVEDPAVAAQREQIAAEIQRAEAALVTTYLAQPTPAAAAEQAEQATDEALSPARVRAAFEQFVDTLRNQATNWQVVVPQQMTTTLPNLRALEDGSLLASGDVTKRDVYTLQFEAPESDEPFTAIRLEALPHESLPAGGPGMAYYEGRRGDFFLSELRVLQDGKSLNLRDASASFGKISIGSGSADAANVIDGEGSTGWSTSGAEGQPNRWVAQFEQPFRPTGPWTIEMVFERHYAAPLGRFRIALAPDSGPATRDSAEPPTEQRRVAVALPIDADAEAELWRAAQAPATPLSADLQQLLRRQFIYSSELLAEARNPIEALQQQMPEPIRTLVMRQRPTAEVRQTHRYHRGEYLQPREAVEPGIPAIFAKGESLPSDRLELAQWLVSPANPLFARVTVDRAWRELLGRGIVDTAGDYGTQSEPPSHPELLDYLALDFTAGGTSLKRLHRELVLSAVYQRAAQVRPEQQALDPDNRLLAKGPRRRLEGERIRDSLLAAAGLLARHWGGPSVYPPQPAIVTAQAYGGFRWTESTGADRFRRSLYTFAKRTAPFAALSVFDGPTGETCQPRRDRSNTPLQALTLLNDSMFVEIAQALADDARRSVPDGQADQVATEIFRRLLTRPPSDEELQAIVAFHNGLETTAGDSWMLVARALMNLDETITLP